MISQNMPSSSDYSAGPRGAALRDSRVLSASTVAHRATPPSVRGIKIEVSRLSEGSTRARRT